MSTTETPLRSTDAELLYEFLGKRLRNGGRKESLELLLAEFAECQRELERLRAEVQKGLDSSERGESRPLDLEALFARVDKRLEAEGIPE